MALDSRADTSTMWLVNPGFTNRPLAPVIGCTRTTGWIATSRLSLIRLEYELPRPTALSEPPYLCSARSPSTNDRMTGDRPS